MGTGIKSRTPAEKVRAAKKAASSNPHVDVDRVEKALNAIAELERMGIQPRGYNLGAPTDKYHTHAKWNFHR